MGGGAGDRVDPGDHVGEVLFYRAGRRAGDAREPDHGKARRALVPPAQGYPDDLLRRDGVLRRGREERGMTTRDSFGSRSTFKVGRRTFEIVRLAAREQRGLPVSGLAYSLRIRHENLLRREDGRTGRGDEIEKLAQWDPRKTPDDEIAFMPARGPPRRTLPRSSPPTPTPPSPTGSACSAGGWEASRRRRRCWASRSRCSSPRS